MTIMTKPLEAKDLIPQKIRTLMVFDQRWYEFLFLPGPIRKAFPSSTTLLDAWGNKGFLMNLRGTLGNEEADRRMNEGGHLGTKVHRAIACLGKKGYVGFLPNEEDEFDHEGREEVRRAIELCKLNDRPYYLLQNDKEMLLMRRFDDLCKAVQPHVHEGDVTVWTDDCCGLRSWGYAGTLDTVWNLTPNEKSLEVAWYHYKEGRVKTAPTGNFVVDYKTGYEKPEDLPQTSSYFKAYEKGLRVKLDNSPLSQEDFLLDGIIIAYLKSQIRTGIEGVKLVYALREEIERDLYPRFLTVGDNWWISHPNAKPSVQEYKRHIYIPSLTAPTGRIVPPTAAGTADELTSMLIASNEKQVVTAAEDSEKPTDGKKQKGQK